MYFFDLSLIASFNINQSNDDFNGSNMAILKSK